MRLCIDYRDLSFLVPRGDGGALVELAAAVLLLGWAVRRHRQPAGRRLRPRRRGTAGTAGLVAAGVLFAASAVLDPTFVGLVVVAGRDAAVLDVALAHLLWAGVSQAPLVVVAAAVARGRHERLVARFQRVWARIAPRAALVLTGVLVLAGAVLAADALTQLATGRLLIAPDAG